MSHIKNNISTLPNLGFLGRGDNIINQNKPSGNRVVWLDILKCMAIFLVLWGHSIQYLRSDSPFDNPVFRFIYSFHMPLFMAVSGFFAQKLCRKSFMEAVTSRFRQLLLPLVTADVIYLIVLGFKPDDSFFNWFWFLNSAFACCIVYYLISKTNKWFWPILIVALALSQLISQLKFGTMFPSYVTGALVGRYFNWFSRNSKVIFWVSLVVFLCLLSGWSKSFFNLGWSEIKKTMSLFDFAKTFIVTRLYVIAIGISGSVMMISLFEYLSHSLKKTLLGNKICRVGQLTLGIYIVQTFVLELFLSHYIKLDDINVWIYDLLVTPLIAVAVMLVCLAIVKIIRINRYTAWLILGEKLTKRG